MEITAFSVFYFLMCLGLAVVFTIVAMGLVWLYEATVELFARNLRRLKEKDEQDA